MENKITKKAFFALFGIIIYLSTASAESFVKEQPSYLPSCKIYEPEFTKCSTNSIQKLFSQFAQGDKITIKGDKITSFGKFSGIPGLNTVGSIDPFFIKKLIYKQDSNQVATISANLTDLVVKGFANTIVKESRVSKKDFSWDTRLLIPKLQMEGKYKMDGKVLVVPIKGNGKMLFEVENMDIKMHTKTRLYEKGGFTFYNVTNVRLDLSTTNIKTHFDNLFNGNKELEKSTNEFFNKNWSDVFEALRPIVTQTVEEIILRQLQPVFHYIPANFFVSDIPTSQQLYGKA